MIYVKHVIRHAVYNIDITLFMLCFDLFNCVLSLYNFSAPVVAGRIFGLDVCAWTS